jgi:hypothetical protein
MRMLTAFLAEADMRRRSSYAFIGPLSLKSAIHDSFSTKQSVR